MKDLERGRAINGADNGAGNYEMDDDYEVITLDDNIDQSVIDARDEGKRHGQDKTIPIRNSRAIRGQGAPPQTACEVSMHQVDRDGLIVRIVPPTEPIPGQTRGPVELVLLIDVSLSMDDLAPVPPSGKGEDQEQKGFTVLDLTKHAAHTIIESLDDCDTLCVVTFSTDCKVLFDPLSMDMKNKSFAKEMIFSLQAESSTYLWSGMKLALDKLCGDSHMTAALIILTDGQPNEPLSNGLIPAMRRWCRTKRLRKMPAPIHAFGFGYNLQDGLLQSIAEFGGGDYCFVPDASMLGTVFNHAIANLKATYAHDAILKLRFPDGLGLTEFGLYIGKSTPIKTRNWKGATRIECSINLRTIQFGQSRDLFFLLRQRPLELAKALRDSRAPHQIRATLDYRQGKELKQAYAESGVMSTSIALSSAEIAFHTSRAMTVDFLSKLFPLTGQGEHQALLSDRLPTYQDLRQFVAQLPASRHLDDPLNSSLIKDLVGAENKKGEVELALQKMNWQKWGRHYLSSLLMAHQYQKCFSFKDPGTQYYGKGSRLFCTELDVLDTIFDALPAPLPSKPPAPPSYQDTVRGEHIRHPPPLKDMSRYRNVDSTCFAGSTNILVIHPTDGSTKTIPIEKLRTGDTVKTLRGRNKVVRTVLKCHTNETEGRTMTVIPVTSSISLWVTPWHPVSQDDGDTWFFPAEAYPEDVYPDMVNPGFVEPVYTVQLEREVGDIAEDHTINVEGLWGVTMGHGLVGNNEASEDRVRAHEFYGDWDAVARSLDRLPRREGLSLGDGTTKDVITGRANGFLPFGNSGL